MRSVALLAGGLLMAMGVGGPGAALAIDCGVPGKAKVFDRTRSMGTAQVQFRSRAVPCIEKGAAGDPVQLSGRYDVFYLDAQTSVRGAFTLPSPWLVNDETRAKYTNPEAPGGPSEAKLGGVRTARQVRFGAKGLGDLQPIDIVSGPPGPAGVLSVFTYVNAADGITRRFCTRWTRDLGSTLRYLEVDGGLGRKLMLEGGLAWNCDQIPGGGSTTTSTSIAVSTTTSSSTTSSTLPGGTCGNGVINAGETCDDGNTSDNDSCPADCRVDACTVGTTTRTVTVAFTPPPGVEVAALTMLVDYPEGRVTIPGTGAMSAATFFPTYPASEVLTRGFDLDHAVRGLVADSIAVPPGPVFQVRFTDCVGAAPPIATDYGCAVVDATDPFTNPVPGVICEVTVP